jgi:hypothetical protein
MRELCSYRLPSAVKPGEPTENSGNLAALLVTQTPALSPWPCGRVRCRGPAALRGPCSRVHFFCAISTVLEPTDCLFS